ncbi:hypothetical protein AWM75_00465 [Aerococcus urinaehominis]|uniref:Uncharacterized protein n=1 Tax=Aerococcus urinaehominis TaxID=128944 RepID=A0A0X8FJM5_9LACT|nr:protocatechuate 3,4-dioxygenase subunit alpha [Aerococcus urinaehominis]AMB98555.1 hypothetical protein AWM75_00465 [Aerococcus urinaehominis]SDL78171.1 protocatechuate 3,4-dioxygenase alpha subunit [Aerococcus urinaehominis]
MVILNPENNEETRRTPQQTVGPYVTLGLLNQEAGKDNNLLADGGKGKELVISGNLFASAGDPIFNVMVEIWQANADGVYNHPSEAHMPGFDADFVGFGRTITDERGYYEFRTILPGAIADHDHPELAQSPHIIIVVHASGVPHPLYTRVYFEDQEHNDNFLNNIPADKAKTLIAKRIEGDLEQVLYYHFDMVLEGEADELALETKVDGEEMADKPDGSGKPVTYFFSFDKDMI